MKKVNVSKKAAEIRRGQSPNVVAVANGQAVKVSRLFGMVPWKVNDKEDEVFISFVHRQRIQLRHETIELNIGELIVIPKGVEYRPVPYGDVELVSV